MKVTSLKSYDLRSQNTAKRATLYKQIPGADIEEGWYYVTRGTWFAPEPERWYGPHGTKRAALQAARKALGGRLIVTQEPHAANRQSPICR